MRRSPPSHDDDPLTRVLNQERAKETPEERAERLERDAQAQRVSESIDADIRREAQKKAKRTEVLLLGQSESGKSTTLKQFQFLADKNVFDRERGTWRMIVYLNLIRSIRRIISTVSEYLDLATDELSEEDEQERAAHSSTFRELRLRISPLLQIEESLMKDMGVPDEFGNASIPRSASPRPQSGSATVDASQPEYFVRPNSGWKSKLLLTSLRRQTSSSDTAIVSQAIDPNDREDPGHILVACHPEIRSLWDNEFVKSILEKRRLRFEEEGGFFLDDADRIISLDYIPTDDDILRCRLKTVGVTEHDFAVNTSLVPRPSLLRIYDVGGARSQRQAWAPYFDTVHTILFLAPISAFDQTLAEDRRINRIEDSLQIWRDLTRNTVLKHVPIVLFLNKCDLLKSKLQSGIQVSRYITSFGTRQNDFEHFSRYIKGKFELSAKQSGLKSDRPIYIHFTTVTDTLATSSLLLHVNELLMRQQLRDVSLMN